jgi:hypothetical protein
MTDPRAGYQRDTKSRLQMALLDVAIWAFLIAVVFAGLLTPP